MRIDGNRALASARAQTSFRIYTRRSQVVRVEHRATAFFSMHRGHECESSRVQILLSKEQFLATTFFWRPSPLIHTIARAM